MRRLLLLLAVLAPAAAPARAADTIFDSARLHETRLAMDPADWQALRDNFRENQFYAANVTIDGTTVQQVGVRSRGVGSRDGVKPALKVDFNKYIKGQRFRDLKSLSLKNLFQDPTMMRERLAMSVFESMGIPAPAVSFTRLFVNDEYWGIYNLVENVEEPFLSARFGENDGNLFSYQWSYPYDLAFRGDDPGGYVPVPFEPETNEETLDASALVAFVRDINQAADEEFVTRMRGYLDVERFLTHLAVENAVQESDGVVGEHGLNNFYLYQLQGQSRFVFIPWDKNSTFSHTDWPVRTGLETNVLVRRLMADPALQAFYLAQVLKAANTYVNERHLLPVMEASYSLIRQAALIDTKKPYTNDEFELAVAGLRGVISERDDEVKAEAAQLGVAARGAATALSAGTPR